MSVQTQIDRISGAVTSALAALTEKGVTVPDGTKVDGLAALIAAIEAGGGTASGDCIPFEKSFTYSVDPVPNASYGFALNGNGYYESQNKGVKSSYAICRINLEVVKETDLTFNVINYAEQGYDYGLFGNLDTAMSLNAGADSNAKQSFKQMASADIVSLTYENVSVGNHFIDVKFIKDGSGDKNNDSIQFAVKDNCYISEEYYPIIQSCEPQLIPQNILKGVDIFGVTGAYGVAYGKFTPAETVDDYVITHGLGAIPNFAVIAGRQRSTTSMWIGASMLMPFEDVNQVAFYSTVANDINSVFSHYSDPVGIPPMDVFWGNATENTITIGASTASANYMLIGGIEYWWVVGVI